MSQRSLATVRGGTVQTEHGQRRLEVWAEPLQHGVAGRYVVSFFEKLDIDLAAVNPADIGSAGGVPSGPSFSEQMEAEAVTSELHRVREVLEGAIEELQTSNEELKASNEEITSINEELQSSNEELETGKEELQSLNEELTTVNAQLQAKMEELDRTTSDLSSLLSSTNIAVIFLDVRYRIRRFTPAVQDLIVLIPTDVGRPLVDLRVSSRTRTCSRTPRRCWRPSPPGSARSGAKAAGGTSGGSSLTARLTGRSMASS